MNKSKNKLRVAVVGCGRISVRHLSAIAQSEQAELVACCDVRPERADEVAARYGVKAYYDFETMLDEVDLDVIHICLPHYLHTPVARAAFARGIHVLSEKPMSIDYDDAVATVEAGEKSGVLYGVIFQCRYNTPVQAVKQAVASGKLGKILSARSVLTWARPDSYYRDSDWKGTWDKEGGGVVIDQAIHSIDLVNYIVDDEVTDICCSMANRGHSYIKVEDTAEGLITYRGGTRYAFYCMNNYGTDEPIEIKLLCEKGKATFGYNDATIEYNDGTCERVREDAAVAPDGKTYWGNRHGKQIERFYRACRGLEPLELSGREALKTHKIVTEIYRLGKPSMR